MSDPAIQILSLMAEQHQREQDAILSTPSQSRDLSPILSDSEDYDTKKQDAHHRRRFERFLNDCGVKRQIRVEPTPFNPFNTIINPNDDSDARESLTSRSYSDFIFSDDEDEEEEENHIRHRINFLNQHDNNSDADEFYNERSSNSRPDRLLNALNENSNFSPRKAIAENEFDHSIDVLDVLDNSDREFEYVQFDRYSDRRYSNINNSKTPDEKKERDTAFERSIKIQLPLSSNDSFLNWEVHNKTTTKEIQTDGNGGTYDAFRPDFWKLDEEPQFIVKLAPGEKFRDSLKLKYYGITQLSIDQAKRFKNNLTACSNSFNCFFTCTNSDILMFEYDFSNKVASEPILRFDTRPTFTTDRDRLVSSWPYFPHTINYCKIELFNNKEVIAVTVDDGKVLIWYVETLYEQAATFKKTKPNNSGSRYYGFKIKPDFQLSVDSSAWGIDFYNEKNLIAVSDNSQSITLFHYSQIHNENQFSHIKSHQLLHNIPDISFIKSDDTNSNNIIRLSAASVSGELVVFECKYFVLHGPSPSPKNSNTDIIYDTAGVDYVAIDEGASEECKFDRVNFSAITVQSRIALGEDCWTTKFIDGRHFKTVQSIRAVTGDPWINEEIETSKIWSQSKILDIESDPVRSSDLGLAACFQFFESPTLSLNSIHSQKNLYKDVKFGTITDEYRRIRKLYDTVYLLKQRNKVKQHKSLNQKKYWDENPSSHFENKYLAVSTSKRLGLFRCDRLICNSATRKLFDLNIPHNDETKYSNRISITALIPKLSAFIAVTQAGMVSIMRLCTHRGVHGMRQEHIFPNPTRLVLGERGYRTISGLGVRELHGGLYPRYLVYITYVDGIVLTYELHLRDDEFSTFSL